MPNEPLIMRLYAGKPERTPVCPFCALSGANILERTAETGYNKMNKYSLWNGANYEAYLMERQRPKSLYGQGL